MIAAYLFLLAVAPFMSTATAADGVLYGLSAQSAQGVQLVTIDPVTGAISPDGPYLPKVLEAQNLATLDEQRGIYYTIFFNESTQGVELLGFNVTDGSVVYDIPLPFVSSVFVGVGEAVDVDTTNGEVFCVGLLTDGATHQLIRVNPRTGAIRVLNKFGLINVLGGAHAFSVVTNEVWLQYAVNNSGQISFSFFAYDATFGNLTKTVPEDMSKLMVTLSYDTKANVFVGLGVDVSASSYKRTIMQLDPKTGTFSTVWTLDDWWVENGGIVTINNNDRVLYCQMQAVNATPTTPFSLVSVDLTTGKVLNSPTLCGQPADCPWSFEFLPNPK